MTISFQLRQVPGILFAVKPPTNETYSEPWELGLVCSHFGCRAQTWMSARIHKMKFSVLSICFARFCRRLGAESVIHADEVANTSAAGGCINDWDT